MSGALMHRPRVNNALSTDVPLEAYTKAVRALDDFDALVGQYDMLLDTQQAFVRTGNFAALFETASRGDKLAREATLCGKRFVPLVEAVAARQFVGPRANEIRRRSFSSRSSAETLGSSASRLARTCSEKRDVMGREIRRTHAADSQAGLPPAYRVGPQRLLDRRG